MFLLLCFFFLMVCLVLLCYRTRYASISLAFYIDELRLFGLLCLTVCDHMIICTRYLSRMKNQHGHWVYWCRWVCVCVLHIKPFFCISG